MLKVMAEITQPVAEPDGTVVLQPGERVDPDDSRVLALPPGHHRLVPVEVDDPKPQPKQDEQPARQSTSQVKR